MPRFTFTFQEASPLITYTGLWTEGNPLNDSFAASYDGSFRVTNSSDGKAVLNFVGSGVELFGALRPNHGAYSVRLDQDNPTISDGRGKNIFKDSLWRADNISYGQHAVEVVNMPTSAAPYFDLDYVTIERQIGFDNDTIFDSALDDTDPLVQYMGSWSPSLQMQTLNHNGTIHQTTTANDSLSINFQGCCIELYGLYANAAYTIALDNQTLEQMQGMNIDLKQEKWHPQTLLYLKDGLPENVNHTVTITATGTTLERPFSFDKAIVRSTQPIFMTGTTSLTAGLQSPTIGSLSPSISAQTAAGVNSSPSPAIPVALIIVLGVGGAVILALTIVTFLLLRRRWWRRPRHHVDLNAEIEPYDVDPVPNPWTLPSKAPAAPPSTWLLSSVVPGWRRVSGDWQTSTGPRGVRSLSSYSQMWERDGTSTTASRQSLTSLPSIARPAERRHFTVTNAGPSARRGSQTVGISELEPVPEKSALDGPSPPEYNGLRQNVHP